MDQDIQKLLIRKAGALLARRSFSRGELRIKLAKFGDSLQVEKALDRLVTLNLLNDADYAYNFALGRMDEQGWGPAKVIDSLLKRQIEQQTINSVMARIREERKEENPVESCMKQYCRKNGTPSNPKDVKRLASHLCRRGFDEDDVYRALRHSMPDALPQNFETGE
jgi:SOS response regulatory protein OraA/RecX